MHHDGMGQKRTSMYSKHSLLHQLYAASSQGGLVTVLFASSWSALFATHSLISASAPCPAESAQALT